MVTPTNDGRDAARIRAAGRRHRGRVLTLDWAAYSRGHGWFAGDGLHLGRAGAAGLARLLGRGLRRLYPVRTRWEVREADRSRRQDGAMALRGEGRMP
jgi:hypothetical protein